MTVVQFCLIFAMSFAQVFLLGFQSQNVNTGKYLLAAIGSCLIAVTQVTLWRWATNDNSWLTILALAAAGASGITTSMYIHRRYIDRS
jgi:Na+/melibiose symporter-like transporter